MATSLQDMDAATELSRRAPSPPPRGLEPAVEVKDSETSVFDFAAVLVRNVFWLLAGAVLGATVALLPLAWMQPEYRATASFTPQSVEPSRAGLAALAGQFGIPLPAGNLNQSPHFYADLLRSRVILARFAHDTVVVTERGSAATPLTSLFGIEATSEEARTEQMVARLGRRVSSKINLNTGTVSVVVTTPWRSVSLAIADRLLERVDAFNLDKRRTQASNERRFVEERLAEARVALRAAENRLESFLIGNLQIASAPLRLTRERLQREVTLRQDVVNTLTQSYEDVRIREVRDTPVITVIEPAAAPLAPVSRRVPLRLIVGVMLGLFASLVVILAREMMVRRRSAGDPHVEEFMQALGSFRDRLRPGRAQRARVPR